MPGTHEATRSSAGRARGGRGEGDGPPSDLDLALPAGSFLCVTKWAVLWPFSAWKGSVCVRVCACARVTESSSDPMLWCRTA